MKKFLKFFRRMCANFWVQLLFLLACSVGIFALGGAFSSESSVWESILEIVTSIDVLSIFLVAVVSLIVAKVVIKANHALEESLKLEDDHHKIISRYSGHDQSLFMRGQDIYNAEGTFMYLEQVPPDRHKPHNMVKDAYSEEYRLRRNDIKEYMAGRLFLSGVCVYANVTGCASVVFADTPRQAELPTFVRENALRLLEAHSSSAIRNSVTIRLSDVTYDDAAGTLTLKTERSQYFYMLVTNRCMDYQLGDGLSVREVFEFRKTVSPLSESRLGNQIGINGLVFTRDGYLLLEKRGKKKATWKDKYAQPISLAMKESDILEELKDGRLGDTPEAAEKVFRRIVLKTIRSNYGLTEKDILPFTLAGNFFGVARDLLEGGKPNLYFYVVADMDAATFRKTMEERTRRAAEHPDEKGLPKLSADKLDSEYFLVDYRKIAVDFGYRLTLSARDMLRIRRKFSPCVSRREAAFDGALHRLRCLFGVRVRRECGEALLACLYFTNLCRERLEKEAHLAHGKEEI